MVATFTKEYKISDIEELADDLKSAWNWSSVDHEEDASEWSFYINAEKTKGIRIYPNSSGYLSTAIIFCGELYFANATSAWLSVRLTSTSSALVFEHKSVPSTSVVTPCPPESYKFIVCTGINQVTGAEEPVVAYYDANTSISNGYRTCIFSNDNTICTASATDRLGDNRSAKVTVLVPMYDKYSECIPKDVYTTSATQLAAISHGDATLGDKKYYMCGSVWIVTE